MKLFILSLIVLSQTTFANTLVKCVVVNPRNVLTLDINDDHLTGTLTELNGSTVAIESTDGKTFEGQNFLGSITLAPGVYTSPASRTHAMLTDLNGNKSVLNCMKRNFPTPTPTPANALVESLIVPGFEDCQVTPPNYGNPHRNYDAKFRLCRAKSVELGFLGEDARRCAAICMKN